MTFEFEYLGEFTFKFENFLDPDTGSQMGSIDEKKLRSKILCKCTFKALWSYTFSKFWKSYTPPAARIRVKEKVCTSNMSLHFLDYTVQNALKFQ